MTEMSREEETQEIINIVKGTHILPLCQNFGVTLQLRCDISDEGESSETYEVITRKEQFRYYTFSLAAYEYSRQVAKS